VGASYAGRCHLPKTWPRHSPRMRAAFPRDGRPSWVVEVAPVINPGGAPAEKHTAVARWTRCLTADCKESPSCRTGWDTNI
jgi:hypothetical protein